MQVTANQIYEVTATTSTGATITLGVRNHGNSWIAFSGESILAEFVNVDDANQYVYRIIGSIEDCKNSLVPNISVEEKKVVQTTKKQTKKTPAKKTTVKKQPAKRK